MTEVERKPLWIAGRRVRAHSGETFVNTSPATGEALCDVDIADAHDVDRAVAAARDAFSEWAETPASERSRVLRKAAELLRARNDELARLEVLDTGKPIAEARVVDVESGAEALDFFASVAATLHGEHISVPNAFVYTRREPLGVCAGIGAWNYPLQIACWKSAPALACGNTMVFKPSELTPVTAMELAAIYAEAGLPAGVFNVVHGGAKTGDALARHPDVAKVSLTGSVETGKAVMAAASGTLKQVSAELGGKSPLLIFADAGLDEAVKASLMANFYTQGEICTNGTRVFVEEAVHDEFVERVVEKASRLRLGDPLDPRTEIGPLISKQQHDKVLAYIESGVKEGARLRCGGGRPEAHELAAGHFVTPTVFDRCTDEMTIVREEIFGPVMSVLSFSAETEALERANKTHFGLAAGVFTRDLQRAHRVAARLQAGICWVNNYNITPLEMPFGGIKQSGLGRENGLAAVDDYTQRKSIYVELGKVDCPYD